MKYFHLPDNWDDAGNNPDIRPQPWLTFLRYFFLQLVLILGAQSDTCGERTQMELSGKVQRKQGKDKSVHERTDEGRRGG